MINIVNRILIDTSITPQCRWLVGILIIRGQETINMHEVYQLAEPHYNNRQMLKVLEEAIKAGYVTRKPLELSEFSESRKFEYKVTALHNEK